MSNYEDLKAQAEKLGIEVDGRWKEARLQEEIDKALEGESDQEVEAEQEDEQESPNHENSGSTYQNVSRCAQSLFGTRIMPGKTYDLTDSDKADKKGMARLDRAVNVFGFFEQV